MFRERERERPRERQRDRERDRDTERARDRHRQRERDTKTERWRKRVSERLYQYHKTQAHFLQTTAIVIPIVSSTISPILLFVMVAKTNKKLEHKESRQED